MNFSIMQGDISGDIVILNGLKMAFPCHFLLLFCNEGAPCLNACDDERGSRTHIVEGLQL